MARIKLQLLFGVGVLFGQALIHAITFNGAVTHQSIEGIGVNVNYRGWEGTNLVPVLDAFMDEADVSVFRLTFDLSDWEAVNDDADSTTYNWAVYNPLYNSPEFNRLWDMLEYLNNAGYSNRVVLTFMGWGPAWMMDADGRSLKPGMEDEWAEMIASAMIFARNARGLQVNLLTPNNEPDIFDEGIRITNAVQYVDTLHRLAVKLDQAGLTNLSFVGPCRSNGPTNFLSEISGDAVIMARLKHFSIHAYNNTQGNASTAYQWITNSAYPDRTLWMTEFNTWCPNCDGGGDGFFDIWSNARATAENLFYHLQANVSGAIVWDGFDSIYDHHYTNWGFYGVIGVDDINAPVKTYTPRKSFYTMAQVSKWVRPGAQRIDVSEPNTWPLTYLAAFKHDALEQVVVSGVNVSSSPYQLEGVLDNLPVVTNLALCYTTATTNLASGGNVPVGANGSFAATIPANCVFTLVGSRAERLVQNTVSTRIGLAPGKLAHYYLDVTNPVARVQFDVMNPTADVSLFVDSDHPSDGQTLVPFASRQPFASPEQVVLREGVGVKDLVAGRWFASVRNDSSSPVAFSLRAFQINESGFPLLLGAEVAEGLVCLEWNAVPGASYVVEGSTNSTAGPWLDVSGTLVTFGGNGSYCLPTSTFQFFRIKEGVSAKGY